MSAAISSLHNRRVVDGRIDWAAIAALYDQLLVHRPTAGVSVARAAALLEAGRPADATRALTAIDPVLVERYQPYWTVLAEVTGTTGDVAVRDDARRRALALTTDDAVAAHLRARWSLDDGPTPTPGAEHR